MRLVDCFFELFYYTLFIKSMDFSQLTYKNVIKHYNDLFQRSLKTAQKAGFSQQEWGKGLFPVCSWIDEYVHFSDWPEKHKWQQNPLQLFFFKTSNAGKEFFLRIDRLGPDDNNVREVYDYCLALGFKGCYFDSESSGKLQEIIRTNLKHFTDNHTLSFPKKCFPDAYSLSDSPKSTLSSPWGISIITILLSAAPVILFVVLFVLYKNSLADIVLKFISASN